MVEDLTVPRAEQNSSHTKIENKIKTFFTFQDIVHVFLLNLSMWIFHISASLCVNYIYRMQGKDNNHQSPQKSSHILKASLFLVSSAKDSSYFFA